MSERDEQRAYFSWVEWQSLQWPELALAFAIPNGQMRKGQAMEPGLKKGVPDIFLPVPVFGPGGLKYCGLFIEMKYGKNKPSKEQLQWLRELAGQAYKTVVCYDAREAMEETADYLGRELAF